MYPTRPLPTKACSQPGAHILSGCCFDPKALDELFPNWKNEGWPGRWEIFVILSFPVFRNGLNEPATDEQVRVCAFSGLSRASAFSALGFPPSKNRPAKKSGGMGLASPPSFCYHCVAQPACRQSAVRANPVGVAIGFGPLKVRSPRPTPSPHSLSMRPSATNSQPHMRHTPVSPMCLCAPCEAARD